MLERDEEGAMTNQQTLASLAVRLQSGQLDPITLVEETLTEIGSHPDKSIFVALTRERATREAQAASERMRAGRSLGLLDGLPVAWKDLFDLAGSVTTAGSAVLENRSRAVTDAAVVAKLASAGMVSIGRTNLSEFAFSGLGINPHYGDRKSVV